MDLFLNDLGQSVPYSDAPHYDYVWLSKLFRMAGTKMPFNQILPVSDLYARELIKNGFPVSRAYRETELITSDIVDVARGHRVNEDITALLEGLSQARHRCPIIRQGADDYAPLAL